MAATRRMDTLALQVLAPDRVVVDEYRYTMNGVHTGQLFLMRGPMAKVAWRSSMTNLTTALQGRWYVDANNVLMVHFDYLGRNFGYKYARLAGPPDTLQGVDYRGRVIRAERVRTWSL